MKRILAITLASTFAFSMQANATTRFEGLVLPPKFYEALAQCETGKDWKHETRTYTSAFGITRSAFKKYSDVNRGSKLSPREQAIVVDRLAFTGFQDGDRFNPPVGPWGFGAIRIQNCMNLQSYICESKKPIVQKYKKRCKP